MPTPFLVDVVSVYQSLKLVSSISFAFCTFHHLEFSRGRHIETFDIFLWLSNIILNFTDSQMTLLDNSQAITSHMKLNMGLL
jgi:hypothetical protein